MAKTTHSAANKALRRLLVEAREGQRLTQAALAKLLGRSQSFVAKLESGERRLDVIEFLHVTSLLKADYRKLLKKIEHLAKDGK